MSAIFSGFHVDVGGEFRPRGFTPVKRLLLLDTICGIGDITIKRYLTIQLCSAVILFWGTSLGSHDFNGFRRNLLQPAGEQVLSRSGKPSRAPSEPSARYRALDFTTAQIPLLQFMSGFPGGGLKESRFLRRFAREKRFGQKPAGFENENFREVTAYNVGDPAQNFGDPCEAASGENICDALDSGFKRCAANFVPFGTMLHIDELGVCTVTDRMHSRFSDRVDIAMKLHEKQKALQFGIKRLRVTVLRGTTDS